MQNITKISDITYQDLADYLRICDTLTADDINTLNTLLTVAKVYVGEYTGRTIQELDDYKDIIIVILILVQDMWDNRTLYVDNNNANKVVESILNLHQVNLL
jgi:hypothetical protein